MIDKRALMHELEERHFAGAEHLGTTAVAPTCVVVSLGSWLTVRRLRRMGVP